MATEVGTAYVTILPSAHGFPDALRRQLGGGLGGAGTSAGRTFGSSFIKGAAALMAGGKIVSILKESIELGSDLAENTSKASVVFGKASQQIIDASKKSATAVGLSSTAYLEATGNIGNLLVSLKVAPKPAADMSQAMVTLAADMASFNNTSVEDALAAIQSGLVGETEPLRKFGVNMNDATLRAQALKMGLISSTKDALSPQTKALAAYGLIMAQSKTAQGDFTRTSAGLANQQRILTARWEDAKTRLGTKLLPVMLTFVSLISNKILPAVEKFAKQIFGQLGPAFSDFGSTFKTDILPALKEIAPQLLTTLGTFLKVGADIAKLVLPVIHTFTQAILWIIQNVPGGTQTIALLVTAFLGFRALSFIPRLITRIGTSAAGATTSVSSLKVGLAGLGAAGVAVGISYVADALEEAKEKHKAWDAQVRTAAAGVDGYTLSIEGTTASLKALLAENAKDPITGHQNVLLATTQMNNFTKEVLQNAKAQGITGESYGKIKLAAAAYAKAVEISGVESTAAKYALGKLKETMDTAKKSGDTLSAATKVLTGDIKDIPSGHLTKITADKKDLETKIAIAEREIKNLPKSKQTKLTADIRSAKEALQDVNTELSRYAQKTYIANVRTVIEGLPSHREGGLIRGPGTGTSDSILARLSDKEYVMPADRTAKFLPELESIRRLGTLPGFAQGGIVGPNIQIAMKRLNMQKVVEEQIRKGVINIGQTMAGAFFGGGSNGNLTQWIARALMITGNPMSWAGPAYSLAMHESAGNPRAINLWDRNAMAGIPSKGLFQVIDPTFAVYHYPGLNDIWSPVDNAAAAFRYINSRYGDIFHIASYTPSGFVGGYAKGTDYVRNDGLAYVHRGEEIIPAADSGWSGERIDYDRLARTLARAMSGIRLDMDGQAVGRVQGVQASRLTRTGR